MSDGSLLSGRYLIQDAVGQGGAGQVFRAWDQHLQRPVAVKRLHGHAETDANIRREAGTLAALHHPNIVTIYDFVADEAGQFAVMELVEGSTLDDVVATRPLSLAAFGELADQVCRGLSAAHHRGLVHRDLKAGNLMLQFHPDRSFTCKILDFGLARLPGETRPEDVPGEVYGSPYTIAPEQLLDEPVTARTDLYALGCTFYLALSGREPFEAEKVQEVLQRHLHDEPTPLHLVAPHVPAPLSHVCRRLMERAPADRPPSAEEVRRLVRSALNAPSAVRPPPGVRRPTPGVAPAVSQPPARKGRSTGAAWCVGGLALAAGAFFFLRATGQHASPPPSPPAVLPPAPPTYPAIDPLDPKGAAQHQGQTVTVEGVVVSVDESHLFGARLLALSDRRDAVVLSVAAERMTLEAARSLVGKPVRAVGQVSTAANSLRVVVASTADLTVEPPAR